MAVSSHLFSVVALSYVLSPYRKSVLMLYHNAKPSDPSYGKYNGLSGPLNGSESVSEAMTRVIREELGCQPIGMRYRGNVHWSRFGREQESVLGHIFLIEGLDGVVPQHTPRGQPNWVAIDHMLDGNLPIWSGDEHFLPLVFDNDPRPFHGFMPYKDGAPRNWVFDRTQ